VEGFAFITVLIPVVEVRVRFFIYIGVAKEVEEITELVLDELDLFWSVPLSVGIQLASSRLKLVGLRGGSSHGSDLVDASLGVRALEAVHLQQVLENALVSVLWLVHEVLVPDDVNGIKL
jgi:hypothetical protein